MDDVYSQFLSQGYVTIPEILSREVIQVVGKVCDQVSVGEAGDRNFLRYPVIRRIAKLLSDSPTLTPLLPSTPLAVQCTYFNKSALNNWLVALHRDQVIPVKYKFDMPGWTGWSVKDGIHYVRPPRRVLQTLVAVRVHLEDNTEKNGALAVVPESHLKESPEADRIVCNVPQGGALIMRPMLLHASSKVHSGERRVLHYLFGSAQLPDQAQWAVFQ